MLISFYKDFESGEAVAKITKFADRIWINEEGDIECHRETYFDLTQGSFKKIFILTPFKNILELEDMTNTLLDENYILNKRSSGEYKLVDKVNRIFTTDYIENIYAVPIRLIQSVNIGACSYIDITFDHEIVSPKKCAFRFKFRINSSAEKLGKDNYNLNLSYFNGRSCRAECSALDISRRELKAVSILDKNRSGGFDILIHLPIGAKATEVNEFCHKGESLVSPSGKEEEKRVQCIWHMREFYENEVNREIGMNNGHNFSVTYTMKSVIERVDDLRNEIDKLKENDQNLRKELKKTRKSLNISTILAIIALLIAVIIPIIISVLKIK